MKREALRGEPRIGKPTMDELLDIFRSDRVKKARNRKLKKEEEEDDGSEGQ